MNLLSYEFLVDLLIHICILTIILSVFFFKIAINIEHDSLKGVVKDNLKDIKKKYKNEIDTILSKISLDNQKMDNDKLKLEIEKLIEKNELNRNINNEKIYKNTKIVILSLLIFTTVIIGSLVISNKLSLKHIGKILVENILIFLIIVSIEAIFFFQVILEYVPVKPTYFLQEFINSINELNLK